MDSTPVVIIEAPHVHGMQRRDLPGLYNTSCGPLNTNPCITQLNLVCVDERCVCLSNYVPDGSGGCEPDMVTLLLTWVIRVFVCTAIFLSCLSLFHLLVTRRCFRGSSSGGGQGDEGGAEEGRRGSTSTCWYDEPPSYLDVAQEAPPPTYLEAVAKECVNSGGTTRGAMEGAEPPQPPLPPQREEEREVDALTFTPPPAPPNTALPLSLHM